MTKAQLLDLLQLLSALESWSFSVGKTPDYMMDGITSAVDLLRAELLK